jgi:glucosamine--fructose-6-phosphate aminotransferase (isomerizing)
MSVLQKEILEQPARLQVLLDAESARIARIAAAIRARAPRFVLIAARGSSDNAARYGQYLFGAHNSLPVALAAPSLFSLYNAPPRVQDSLVLAISQSGQSPDILAVIEEARKQGALTLALTNDPSSPLAGLAEHTIDLQAGAEKSVAATKTYTTSLMALAMLSTALAEDRENHELLRRVPTLLESALANPEASLAQAQPYKEAQACVVLGRGYNYATAFEIALKLKELTYVLAEPYSSADFQHGPVALVENGFLVISIVAEGRTSTELAEFLEALKPRSPRLVAISPLPQVLAQASTAIPIPSGIPEWLSPIVAIAAGQLFVLGLARAKGLDPDHPRGLNKVTLTH